MNDPTELGQWVLNQRAAIKSTNDELDLVEQQIKDLKDRRQVLLDQERRLCSEAHERFVPRETRGAGQ